MPNFLILRNLGGNLGAFLISGGIDNQRTRQNQTTHKPNPSQ